MTSGGNLAGKNIFVTGADGFIGSHLVERLVELGGNVTAMVQYNSFNSWGWIDTMEESKKKEIRVVAGDIRQFDNIRQFMKSADIVFHLAALIAIPYSYVSPSAYVRTNIEGTLNVVQAALEHGVSKVIHTSTSEVYGTAKYVPIDENHPLQGQSPYSASKIGADKIAESFHLSFNLPVVTVRPFNTYGPRQSARAVIPTVISKILSGSEVIELGALYPTRDFNYVLDTVEGFVEAALSDKTIGEVINIGSGVDVSIGDLVNLIIKLTGKDVKIVSDSQRLRPEKSEVRRLLADNEKCKRLTGWESKYSLEQGLKETIRWIGDNMQYFKTDIYNI